MSTQTETCKKCGLPKELCNCKGDEKVEKLIVEHQFMTKGKPEGDKGSRDPSKAELQAKLSEREDQLAMMALKKLDREKKALLEKFPESRREQLSTWIGEDPDRLEQIRGSLIASGQITKPDGTTTPPPSGKAKAYGSQTKQGSGRYSDPTINVMSELYNIVQDPTASREEKAEAERRIDEMYKTIRKGTEAGIRAGRITQPRIESATHCFKCGQVVTGAMADSFAKGSTPCPNCGYKVGSRETIKRPFVQPR